MAVPTYQSFMLPLLRNLDDGKEHTLKEISEKLATQFNLSDEDKSELLPSGQLTYKNRIAWARTYLSKAGLLISVGRARFLITDRGSKVLKENLVEINTKYLEMFPEFMEFKNASKQNTDDNSEVKGSIQVADTEKTPEDLLYESYKELRRELAHEILEKVKSCSPSFFEKLVVDLLVAMGYGGSRRDAGQAIGKSGDEGIDGIINEDKLGLDVIYIQAKKWENPVGRPAVQAFAGSLEGQRAKKGVFITTSRFSQEAKDYVKVIEKKIVLIDGDRLAQLMIDYNIGVSEQATYILKRMDMDYFDDEEFQ